MAKTHDDVLVSEGLRLTQGAEKLEIIRRSVQENVGPGGLVSVYDFGVGHFRRVLPIEAIVSVSRNQASIEARFEKGRAPGGPDLRMKRVRHAH